MMASRTVALCYIRQSYTRNENDMHSPERQRANIEAYCAKKGWTPEWYVDAEGHQSGRSVKNRPGWLALEERLGDPDVVALVANDLARIHRKTWRIGQLLERAKEANVQVVLAEPGREIIDTSTPMGELYITILAMQDEAYANDISHRAKDSIQYRKSQGKTVGLPPFGSIRNSEGYLIPDPAGAWLLPNGEFVAGDNPEQPPQEGAIWRGYHAAAEHVLRLYAEGHAGLEKLAYRLNEEGWPFHDRDSQPRAFLRHDVRRVVASWMAYGGVVGSKRAKDVRAYEPLDVDAVLFVPERAVFEVDLLREVGKVRQARSRKPVDSGKKAAADIYPLSVVCRCAHCERLAEEKGNPDLRTTLTGHTMPQGKRRYEHRRGVTCGCASRSIAAELIEDDMARLIKALEVRNGGRDLMVELMTQAEFEVDGTPEDIDAQKSAGIALCRRRIDAAVHLYSDGVIDRDEYLRRREDNEREITQWESRTANRQRAVMELKACVEFVHRIGEVWRTSRDEYKQQVIRLLFELDHRRS